MDKPKDQVVKIRDFLGDLSQKGIVKKKELFHFKDKLRDEYYSCRAKEEGCHLEIKFSTFTRDFYYIYQVDSRRLFESFERFFELLHPEVKKYFAYHLDLFR